MSKHKPAKYSSVFAGRAEREIHGASLSIRFNKGLHAVLEDYLTISKNRTRDPFPILKLQSHLLIDLIMAESAVKSYKSQLKEATIQAEKQPENLATKELCGLLDGEIMIHQGIQNAIRDIADGLAWRLFDYDRTTIYMLADKPSGKHLSHEGLQEEAIALERKYDSLESVTILNDLTHCLKVGDLTTCIGDDEFEITEVKSEGRRSGRITRQRKEMNRIVNFLNTGKEAKGQTQYVIRDIDVTPTTYFARMQELINSARREGGSWMRYGDMLVASCIHWPTAIQHEREKIDSISREAYEAGLAPLNRGDVVIPTIGREKYRFVRNLAPYSVFPINHRDRVELATGAMFIQTMVNVSSFVRLVESNGWRVKKPLEGYMKEAEEGKTPDAIVTVSKGGVSIQVPWVWLGRISQEFMRPETAVSALEAILEEGSGPPAHNYVNFKGEAKIWD